MQAVVQRVLRAAVHVDGETVGAIGRGCLILLGVERDDTEAEADTLASKLAKLRFFPGRTPMDRTLADIGGACLVVSQFTLAASLDKGNRPSFTHAAAPDRAELLYTHFADRLRSLDLEVATGRFAASMQVELINDGPVTWILRVQYGA